MGGNTPQITPAAALRGRPAAPAGFEGPAQTDALPCEERQAAEQVGPAAPSSGISETNRTKPGAPSPDLCSEQRMDWVTCGAPFQPGSYHQEREQPPSCPPLTLFNNTFLPQTPFRVTPEQHHQRFFQGTPVTCQAGSNHRRSAASPPHRLPTQAADSNLGQLFSSPSSLSDLLTSHKVACC